MRLMLTMILLCLIMMVMTLTITMTFKWLYIPCATVVKTDFLLHIKLATAILHHYYVLAFSHQSRQGIYDLKSTLKENFEKTFMKILFFSQSFFYFSRTLLYRNLRKNLFFFIFRLVKANQHTFYLTVATAFSSKLMSSFKFYSYSEICIFTQLSTMRVRSEWQVPTLKIYKSSKSKFLEILFFFFFSKCLHWNLNSGSLPC